VKNGSREIVVMVLFSRGATYHKKTLVKKALLKSSEVKKSLAVKIFGDY